MISPTNSNPSMQPLPLPLIVEVRDDQGRLANGVEVLFTSQPTVLGLGSAVTDWPLRVVSSGGSISTYQVAVPGQAATLAQPYEVGLSTIYCSVYCSVTPPATSDQAIFTIRGY